MPIFRLGLERLEYLMKKDKLIHGELVETKSKLTKSARGMGK